MGMELGIDKRQLEALKAIWRSWCADPIQLRFVVVLAITTLGYFAVMSPAANSLASARVRRDAAEEGARMAEEVLFYKTQVELYEPRAVVSAEVTEWQTYVLHQLAHTSLNLTSLEPRKTVGKGPFKIIEMEMTVRGQVYGEVVDFIDRLERGHRLMRFERVRIEKQKNAISLSCTVLGMVKPGVIPADKSGASEGRAEDAGAMSTGAPAAEALEPPVDGEAEGAAGAPRGAARQPADAGEDSG